MKKEDTNKKNESNRQDESSVKDKKSTPKTPIISEGWEHGGINE